MSKRAIIMYGPPGAGKGTQAELLSRKMNVTHFDTGRYIESLVHSKEAGTDPVLKQEQINFDEGKLCTPSWVLNIIEEATRKIALTGQGVVFSGSPRTMYEAFGEPEEGSDAEKRPEGGLIKVLEEIYGKDNIIVFTISIDEASSIKRNSTRMICSVCGLPIMSISDANICGFCGGPAKKRTLDNPEVIKVRLEEYKKRTYPIIKQLKQEKYRIEEIDGTPAPYKVFEQILSSLSPKIPS